MTDDRLLLVIGGSMTHAWTTWESGLRQLGLKPAFCGWHAQAWRHRSNTPPYQFEPDALKFNDVLNNSIFYPGDDKLHTAYGTKVVRPLSRIAGIVFTQPTSERGFMLSLYNNGYYVYSPDFPQAVDDKQLRSPISTELFVKWWSSHQYYSDAFLQECHAKIKNTAIFISPEILPREEQNYTLGFRQYYKYMMAILMNKLAEKYRVGYCVQPEGTYEPARLYTYPEFAREAPDHHHYKVSYVEAITKTEPFQAFLNAAHATAAT